MKKFLVLTICALAAILSQSCKKNELTDDVDNSTAKKYLEAWMRVNYPEAQKASSGVYYVSETAGNGPAVGTSEDNPFVRIKYTARTLDGDISSSTEAQISKQLGTYNETYYYGPEVMYRGQMSGDRYYMQAGLNSVLEKMNVGGTAKVVIPGWLNTFYRLDDENEYYKKINGDPVVYEISVEDAFNDVVKWEIDSLDRYAKRNNFPDSLKYGFYYRQLTPPTNKTELGTGDLLTINYTGLRLDGQVFDTTIERTAKSQHIYNASNDYSTVTMYFDADDYTGIKMGTSSDGSTVVDGFAYMISKMNVGEYGLGLFYSGLGYQGDGSGNLIPAYSPLMFLIEVTGKND